MGKSQSSDAEIVLDCFKRVFEVEDVAKIGRPMQKDRLNRLKSAVDLLKEALSDLRSGSISLEKFKQVGSVLGGIIAELQSTAKAAEANRGITDARGLTPDKPNVGSGIQPDTSTVGDVSDVSDDVPKLADVLKIVEDLKKHNEDLAAEIEELKKKPVEKTAKTMAAPSAPPEDGGSDSAETAGQVAWPRDMNELPSPKERARQ